MSTDATPPKKDDSAKGCMIIAGVIVGGPLVLLLLLFIASALFGDESNNDEAQAIVACESEVRDQLKAPSSADLRSSASQSGERWIVVGTVDAENSFGAKIRNEFECSVGVSGDYAVATITSWR